MPKRTVAVGAVTKGFELKEKLREHLLEEGHTVLDLGCYDRERFVAYPSVGEAVAHALHTGDADFGVVVCNFGTSSSLGVAKYRGVCACNCESVKTAEAARKVNGMNALCLGASVVEPESACAIVDTFVNSEFLDQEGVSEEMKEFRRQAREQIASSGEIPESRILCGC